MMKTKQRVTDETFDIKSIIGKPFSEVLSRTDLDWETCYPTVDQSDMTVCRPGFVDGNWPTGFNGGEWHVVDDQYAVAGTAE
jgi:hypothetical protein